MNVERTLRLHYSSETANPRGFIELDAAIYSTQLPWRTSVQVLDIANGLTAVTLSNGDLETFFLGDTGIVRLAAQFDASMKATGAYWYRVIVRNYYGPSTGPFTILSDTVDARVLIQNESGSPFGAGWTVHGLERLYPMSDGSGALLVDGTGRLRFFTSSNCLPATTTCAYTAPKGDVTILAKHALEVANDSAIWTLSDRVGGSRKYGSSGFIRREQDRFQNLTRYEYTGGGARLWKVTDPMSKTIMLSYNGSNLLSTITLPDGRTSTLTRTVLSNADSLTIRDPDNAVALAARLVSGRPVQLRGRGSGQSEISYDGVGQLSKIRAPAVKVHGSSTPVSDSVLIFSLHGRLLPLDGEGDSIRGPALPIRKLDSAYTRTVNSDGSSVRTRQNAVGAPVSQTVTSPTGVSYTNTWRYDSLYRLVEHTTPTVGGSINTYTGALVSSSLNRATGQNWTYTYGSYDQILTIRLNGDLQYTATLGGSGGLYVASEQRDTANRVDYTYDSRGRVLTATSSASQTTNWYGATHGNTDSVRVVGSAVATTRYSYDASGRRILTTDPTGRTVRTIPNVLNRDSIAVGTASDSTKYSYDDLSGVYSITDPRGLTYIDSLNARGWKVAQRDPRGRWQQFAYDAVGRIRKFTNRNGDSVTFSYDAQGRLQSRVASGRTTTFAYDSLLRWVAAQNDESIDTIHTDAQGRFSSEVMRVANGAQRFRIARAYLLNGMPNGVNVTASGVASWGPSSSGLGYDPTVRTNAILDFAGKQTTIKFDKFEQPSLVTLPTSTVEASKVKQQITYAPEGRATSSSYTGGGATGFGRVYSDHDASGRVGSIAYGAPGTASLNRYIDYDVQARVRRFRDLQSSTWTEYFWIPNDPYNDCPGCTILDSIVHYDTTLVRADSVAYDLVGNPAGGGITVESNSNRLLQIDGYALVYDSAGYLRSRKKVGEVDRYYYWNALGQLDSMSGPGGKTTYGYDGWGRRIRKTVNGAVTRYLWYNNQLITELNGSHQPVAEYTYYPGTDQPHSVKRNGQIYYYVQDAMGNVTGLLTSTGAVANLYEYTPFGAEVSATESVPNPYRFKGREWDAEAGLYYMRARYYDPTIRRFISEDPVGLGGGLNIYTFAGNDPVNFADPSGLDCEYVAPVETVTITWNGRNLQWNITSTIGGVVCPSKIPNGHGDPPKSPHSSKPGGAPSSGTRTIYLGFTASRCTGAGVTGGFGVVLWSSRGPGIYSRAGGCYGVNDGAGAEAGAYGRFEDFIGPNVTACGMVSAVARIGGCANFDIHGNLVGVNLETGVGTPAGSMSATYTSALMATDVISAVRRAGQSVMDAGRAATGEFLSWQRCVSGLCIP